MGGIVWLASYPKSGNTWVRAFLHNFMRDPDRSYDINRLADLTVGDSQIHWYQEIINKPGADYTEEEVQRMRPQVHRRLSRISPDTIVCKTHNALMEDDGHPLVTMEVTAGAIYVVRNPLDVAVSYSHHLGLSIDRIIQIMNTTGATIPGNEQNVYELQGSWTENVETWTDPPNPRIYVVRYEDMLEAPVRAFAGIVKFLGIAAPRQRIEKAVKLSSFRVLQDQERRQGFRERPLQAKTFFREGKAGQWHKALSQEQVAALVAVHRTQMARFGYVPPGL
jgi:hypothetical protein